MFACPDIDQLTRILALCGTPTQETMDKISSVEAKNYINSLPRMEKKKFNEVFSGANPVAIDLLEAMLEIDPDRRITAEQTLAHPYLAQVTMERQIFSLNNHKHAFLFSVKRGHVGNLLNTNGFSTRQFSACFSRLVSLLSLCLINNLFQYAGPTDEPNSAPYDQTFEAYDLQVSEWKGENTASSL